MDELLGAALVAAVCRTSLVVRVSVAVVAGIGRAAAVAASLTREGVAVGIVARLIGGVANSLAVRTPRVSLRVVASGVRTVTNTLRGLIPGGAGLRVITTGVSRVADLLRGVRVATCVRTRAIRARTVASRGRVTGNEESCDTKQHCVLHGAPPVGCLEPGSYTCGRLAARSRT